MKTKTIISVVTMLFLASMILNLGCMTTTGAKEPSERFKGYNTESAKWTTGNLGKEYYEGDWVSYVARIDKESKIWGATEFSISFNFHQDTSNAIYVAGFDTSVPTGFQYSTGDFLPDGTETPPAGWGIHIPTPEAGEAWVSGPKITNYMNAWPPGTLETPTPAGVADERYFSVNGLPWGSFTDHVILFYRSNLARDIIWSNGLEKDLPKVLDGDEFETWPTTAKFKGASFATGSSRHFYLQYPGIGRKTIPIPIVLYPEALINGHKYVDNVLYNGWKITLTGELELGPSLPPVPYSPPPVFTGDAPWTAGYFEFTGLVEGTYKVAEEDRYAEGIWHFHIDVTGDATSISLDVPAGWAMFDLERGKTATVDFYNTARAPSRTTTELIPNWCEGPMYLGYHITDKVTVRPLVGDFPVPTGTVDLYVEFPAYSDTWTYIGTETLVGHYAYFTYTPLAVGTYRFQAFYSGDSNYEPSESNPEREILVVYPAP